MFTTVKQSKRTDTILTKGVIDKYRLERKRLLWHTWRDYIHGIKTQKRTIVGMMRVYRRHKVSECFRKYKKITFTTRKPVKLLGFTEEEAD